MQHKISKSPIKVSKQYVAYDGMDYDGMDYDGIAWEVAKICYNFIEVNIYGT